MTRSCSTLRVTGCPSGLNRGLEALEQFLAAHGLDLPSAWPLKVALDEVFSNVVKHAYGGRSDGTIDRALAILGDEIEVTVVDDGAEGDPLGAALPDTTAPLAEREPGALGVYLLRRLTDRVAYERRDGRNYLVFARRVAVAPGAGG